MEVAEWFHRQQHLRADTSKSFGSSGSHQQSSSGVAPVTMIPDLVPSMVAVSMTVPGIDWVTGAQKSGGRCGRHPFFASLYYAMILEMYSPLTNSRG
jgi:hypothetical protein